MPAIMPTVQYWIGDPSQYNKSRKKKKWGMRIGKEENKPYISKTFS